MIFKASSKDGNLVVEQRELFRQGLMEMNGKQFWLALIEDDDKHRSCAMNSVYFGLLGGMERYFRQQGYAAYTKARLHGLFKKYLLTEMIVDPVKGTEIEIVSSTAKLSPAAFRDYALEVCRIAVQDFKIEPVWLEPYLSCLEHL